MLADELNEYLESITTTSTDDLKMDLYEMIASGENNLVEFKTTLRYDMTTGSINKTLEEVILKTIAAFSNAQGGTLIMGVSDDLEIIGLEYDYKSLRNGTKDEFELHLRNLTNNAYGPEFSSTSLDISFPIVDDTEICVIEIKQWHKPLYTKMSDRHGVKSEKFYLRNGNSSTALPLNEVATYVNSRFD
jgi:predicted HTH transcriptional regulator